MTFNFTASRKTFLLFVLATATIAALYFFLKTQESAIPENSALSYDTIRGQNTSVNTIVLDPFIEHSILEELGREHNVSTEEMTTIWNAIISEEEAKDIDPLLMLAIIQQESGFDRTARSYVGALGLTQVMPQIHRKKIRDGESLTNPTVSVRVGAQVFNEYLARENGNVNRALQRYNGSLKDKKQRYAQRVLAKKNRLEQKYWQALLAKNRDQKQA